MAKVFQIVLEAQRTSSNITSRKLFLLFYPQKDHVSSQQSKLNKTVPFFLWLKSGPCRDQTVQTPEALGRSYP